ncbi:PAS domain-containing protein [Desulfocastanea catecholica]
METLKRPQKELSDRFEERLQFETLLADLSTRYINLPIDQVDSMIEDDQRRICEFLSLDLSTLWQWEDGARRFITLTHAYIAPGGPARPKRIEALNSFPWIINKLQGGETLILSTEQMPPEAAIDQEVQRYYGVKSSVVMPLTAGGGPLLGVLSFDTLWEERDWPKEIVTRLKLVAQIFSNVLARKEWDRKLLESEARLALAADSAGAGLWALDVGNSQFWATDVARTIFGYVPGENVSLERFEKSIYPDDLEQVQQAISLSFDKSEPLNTEYRILRDDGSMAWIHSSGRPYYGADGKPDRLLGVSIDITKRKNLESRHIKSRERLASAVDIALLGFYEMAENHQITFLDDRMRYFLGISLENESDARQFWLTHIHHEDLPYLQTVIRGVLEEGVNHYALDYRYVHPERGLTWIHHLSRVLERDNTGRATRAIGVMQDITERKIMEQTLRENSTTLRSYQKDLQNFAGRLISGKEEELRRLSRELHDDLTQRLAVIAIEVGKLEMQMKNMELPPPDSCQSITDIKEHLIDVSKDIHRIARQLHPTILDDLGLVRAIESQCAGLMQRSDIVIIFKPVDVPERFFNDIPLCIYRIVQEGLKNIVEHSGAGKCEITLQGKDNALTLTIRDDGKGFDPEEVRGKPGLGLSSMRERVHLVGGEFAIETLSGQGTTIQVTVPINGGDS